MYCLHCGKKLAIFRKSSGGDFCNAEHRDLYAARQGADGLARLIEAKRTLDTREARPPDPPSRLPEPPEMEAEVKDTKVVEVKAGAAKGGPAKSGIAKPGPAKGAARPVSAKAGSVNAVAPQVGLEPVGPDPVGLDPVGRDQVRPGQANVQQVSAERLSVGLVSFAQVGPVPASPANAVAAQMGAASVGLMRLAPAQMALAHAASGGHSEALPVDSLTGISQQNEFLTEPIRPAYRTSRCRRGTQELLLETGGARRPAMIFGKSRPASPALACGAPALARANGQGVAAIGPADHLEDTEPLSFSATALFGPPLPGHTLKLHAAGLLAPWSTAASEEGLDLALSPMVAAAWARDREVEPIPAPYEFDFAIQICWPALRMKPDLGFDLPVVEQPEAQLPVAEPEPAEAWRSLEPDPAQDEPEPEVESWIPFYVPTPNQISARQLRLREEEFLEPLEVQTELAPISDEPEEPKYSFGQKAPKHSRWDDDYYEADTIVRPGGQPAPYLFRLPSAPVIFGAVASMFLVLSGVALFSVPKSSSGLPSLRIESLRSALRSRAALRLDEDFRGGLAEWQGPANWSKDWSYDQAGFLRPGRLGLWSKSMELSDYKVEFLGQIERKSIGWVFRANDPGNFYAAKIMLSKPGPLPSANLVHFTVTNGKPGPRISVPIPFQVRNDTIYQVQMEVKNNQFATRVNGRLVDFWSDNQFRKGGVGFLSDPGELARVRWLRVSNRDDVVGRICSFLTAGSWTPNPDVLSATAYVDLLDPSL